MLWDFDDRPWVLGDCFTYNLPGGSVAQNCPGNYASGMIVQHTYETSSADLINPGHYGDPGDKPRNGPDLDGNLTLASYQVRVTTCWLAEWAMEYDRYECKNRYWSDCLRAGQRESLSGSS